MPLALDGGQGRTIPAEAVLGRFVDAAYAYRFGERSHDVVHAVWVHDESDLQRRDGTMSSFGERAIIADASLSLVGDARPLTDTGLTARVESIEPDGSAVVAIAATSFAQLVRVGSGAYRAADSYFSLTAGVERRIRMTLVDPTADPTIVVEALNDAARLVVRVERGGCADDARLAADQPSAS